MFSQLRQRQFVKVILRDSSEVLKHFLPVFGVPADQHFKVCYGYDYGFFYLEHLGAAGKFLFGDKNLQLVIRFRLNRLLFVLRYLGHKVLIVSHHAKELVSEIELYEGLTVKRTTLHQSIYLPILLVKVDIQVLYRQILQINLHQWLNLFLVKVSNNSFGIFIDLSFRHKDIFTVFISAKAHQ